MDYAFYTDQNELMTSYFTDTNYPVSVTFEEGAYLTRVERRLGRKLTTTEVDGLMEAYRSPESNGKPMLVKCAHCGYWMDTRHIVVRPIQNGWVCDECVPF